MRKEEVCVNQEFGVDEFEVGKWYITKAGEIVNYQKYSVSYGRTPSGEWYDSGWVFHNKHSWRKATEAEAVEALKKECVKRYGEYWETAKINAHADVGCKSSVNNGNGSLLINTITVWNKNGNLFYHGKWAEPLKEPETITKEVWVNIFPNGIKAHDKEEAALFAASLSNDVATVKGALTYQIEKK